MADKHLVNLFSPTRRPLRERTRAYTGGAAPKEALPEGSISSAEIGAVETAQFTLMPYVECVKGSFVRFEFESVRARLWNSIPRPIL